MNRKRLTLYILRCVQDGCSVRYGLAHDLADGSAEKATTELTLNLAMETHLLGHLYEYATTAKAIGYST